MASTIVTPQQFIPSEQLLYTKPKVNASGGKSVGIINSSTRRSLMVSTPLMLNWGVNVFEKEGGNAYSISLQFPREEFSNDQINDFHSMLEKTWKPKSRKMLSSIREIGLESNLPRTESI